MFSLARLRRLPSDERGNAIFLAVATLPLLIGAAATAIDVIQLSLSKRQMQRAADSGALAGAYAVAQNKAAAASVTRDLTLNSRVTLSGPPVVENAPTVGDYAGDNQAVRVALTAQRSLPFISFFTNAATTIAVEATAKIVKNGRYCMVALEEGDVTGISFTGNASVKLGCGVISNSTATNAVSASGSATVIASPISAVGGVPNSSSYASGTQVIPYVIKQPDPFADLPVPAPTGCGPKVSVGPGSSLSLTPGCYRGMDIKGTLNLAAGTYYIAGGSFDLGAQAVVTGAGVTIVLTSETPTDSRSFADIEINGGATVDLTAPTSGPFAGVLIYQDARAPYAESKINGNSGSKLKGALYFPSQMLTFNGNSGLESTCLQLIARRLSFSGSSSLTNDCEPGDPQGFDALFVRLVG